MKILNFQGKITLWLMLDKFKKENKFLSISKAQHNTKPSREYTIQFHPLSDLSLWVASPVYPQGHEKVESFSSSVTYTLSGVQY